jgi:endonuclease I
LKKISIYLILFSGVCVAQIPFGYYNPAIGLTGNPLKIALHNIIKGHTTISYSGLWTAFKKTDIKSNGKVWDMYSNVPSGIPPYEYTFVTNQCGSYALEGDCYNREHSWPQSWFNSVAGPVSDLFHIYPTDGKVNGQRSNYPYGNVTTASWSSLNGGKLGQCTNPGYGLTVFEPIDEYKGDLARGYFYMCTRYYSEDGAWSFSDATNKSDILPWEMNVLLQWSHLDPVSLKEKSRNDSIYYKFQNNRNPFIDHPEWADSIWTINTSVFLKELEFTHSFSVLPNPALDQFYILNKSKTSSQNVTLKISSITGKIIEEQTLMISESTPINCSNWEKGVYFINISNKNSISNFKFIKQ